MTGWRIGWMLVPERLRRAVDVLTGNFTICPPVIAQRACLAAFADDVVRRAGRARRALRRQPRPCCSRRCPARHHRLAPADGAFYVYADIGHLTDDSMAWSQRLLAETGVAVAPGVDFDTDVGDRFVRLQLRRPAAPTSRRGWTGCPQRWPAEVSPGPPARAQARQTGRGRGGGCTATPSVIRTGRPAASTRPTTSAARPTPWSAAPRRCRGRARPPTRCAAWPGTAARRCAAPPPRTTTPPTPSTGTPPRSTGSGS